MSANLRKRRAKEVNIGALEVSRGNLNNSATNTNLSRSHMRVCVYVWKATSADSRSFSAWSGETLAGAPRVLD